MNGAAIDWSAWQVGLIAVQMAAAAAAVVYTWWANRNKAIAADLAALERRVAKLEQDMQHQPGREEFGRLSERLALLHADLKGVIGSVNGMQRAVDLMNQHLLERSSK